MTYPLDTIHNPSLESVFMTFSNKLNDTNPHLAVSSNEKLRFHSHSTFGLVICLGR